MRPDADYGKIAEKKGGTPVERQQTLQLQLVRCFQRVNVDAEYRCDKRDADGLVYYLHGGQHFDFPGTSLEGAAGEALYLPFGGHYHNRLLMPDTTYYQLDFLVWQDGAPRPLLSGPEKTDSRQAAAIGALLGQLVLDCAEVGEHRPFSRFATLCRLLDLLTERQTEQAIADRIYGSVRYLQTHYRENTPMEQVAALSSTCVSNLERLFRRYYGMTPGQYRNNLRINQSKNLLLSGCSPETAALEVGFSDVFYFSKMFRRITGMTPGEFQRRNRNWD